MACGTSNSHHGGGGGGGGGKGGSLKEHSVDGAANGYPAFPGQVLAHSGGRAGVTNLASDLATVALGLVLFQRLGRGKAL